MVNKKYLLLAGLCSVLAAQPAQAQESESASASWSGRDMTYRGENYDVLDSSYYSGKRLDQYRRYMNHQTPFPPKPNNMWEIGVNLGAVNILGDVNTKSPFSAKKPFDAMGFGLTVRKALGHTFSMRFQYLHGRATGLDYRPSNPNNSAWAGYNSMVFHNYRTRMDEFSLQLVGAVNNINFYKARNVMSLYGLIGVGLNNYDVFVDRENSNDNNGPYNFNLAPGYPTPASWSERESVNEWLENELDGDYESRVRDRFDFIITAGVGLQFKLSDRVVLSIEDRVGMPFVDYMDGIELSSDGGLSPEHDLYNYLSLGLNFNIGNKAKNVLPLWWVNPLDHVYSELSDPRHMRLPDPILSDSDGDGVADQFDKCPGTPAGVAVDTKGCPLDTDGDGVPDFRDKQLITPTECQPVEADGVGKCPCPDGCGTAASSCPNIGAGSLSFSGSSSSINSAMQNQLANLAAQMQANPTCKVVIVGNGNSSKVQQQRSWDRVNAVISHMSDRHGIDRNRFIFQYGGTGSENTVTYRPANEGEEGPSNVAPPFPNLRRN